MPTFGENARQVEAYLIGFNGDLYGRTLRVELVDWIREQWKLPGVDEDMSRNNRGRVAAGDGPLDIVLANSWATPGELTGE